MIRPIVLIHGAWHGAWCWERVVSGLETLDLPVAAVDLPFTAFDDDVETARRAIRLPRHDAARTPDRSSG